MNLVSAQDFLQYASEWPTCYVVASSYYNSPEKDHGTPPVAMLIYDLIKII